MHGWAGPWTSAVVLALLLCLIVDQTEAQNTACTQTDPTTCPVGYYCDSSSGCVQIKNNANNETTYIIVGCVIGALLIIIIVIIILSCGQWEWLKRFRQRMGPKKQPIPFVSAAAYPQLGPNYNGSRDINKKLKLRFGAVKKNPYMSSAPYMSSDPYMNSAPYMSSAPYMASNNVEPSFISTGISTPYGDRNSYPKFVVNANNTSFSNTGFDGSSSAPYVATLALNDNSPAPAQYAVEQTTSQYPSQRAIMQVAGNGGNVYRSGSLEALNLFNSQIPLLDDQQQAYSQPGMYQSYSQPQINIQAPYPSMQAPSQTGVIPHTHQVFPQLYPSLSGTDSIYNQAAPAYTTLPQKY